MSNVFLVRDNGKNILIDAGMPWDENHILRILRQDVQHLDLIFLTHAHLDHYGSSKNIHELTKAPIAIHQGDAALLQSGKTYLGNPRGFGSIMKLIVKIFESFTRIPSPEAHFLLNDEDDLQSLGFNAEIIHTPGHTPGSSTLLLSDGLAFVGDLVSKAKK